MEGEDTTSTSGYEVPVKERVYGGSFTGPDPQAAASQNTFAWNSRFQEILQEVGKLDVDTDYTKLASAVWGKVDSLNQDLVYCASTYAKVIISELGLPLDQKTIRPLTSTLGGVAGGEKYVVANLLFKFAVDASGLFGGDDSCAAKVATADLRGLNYLLACDSALFFPMMVLCDYRGFRMIAESIVPIEPDSLVYGSSTGGRVVRNEDPIVDSEMKAVGLKLNLLPHLVGGKLIHTAGDLEVHRSAHDGKYYAVDFSRVFPLMHALSMVAAEAPSISRGNDPALFQGAFLYRHLRPEFVRSYKAPLSSDAFSGFGKLENGYRDTGARVEEATAYLHSAVIPKFAKQLLSRPLMPDRVLHEDMPMVLMELHAAGINMRHLGLVRQHVGAGSPYSTRLLIEMVGRLLKCELSARIRNAARRSQVALEAAYKHIAVDYFNMVFGVNGVGFWRGEIKAKLQRKFHRCLFPEELEPTYDIREQLSHIPGALYSLFVVSCQRTCLRFREHTDKRFLNSRTLHLSTPFHIVDLEQLQERIKAVSLFTFAAAYALQSNGLSYATTDKDMHRHLITASLAKYREALTRMSASPLSLRNYAQLIAWEGDRKAAGEYFQRALDLAPHDPSNLLAMAKWYGLEERIADAAEYHARAVKAKPLSRTPAKKFVHFVLKHNLSVDMIKAAFDEVIARDGDPDDQIKRACARSLATVNAARENREKKAALLSRSESEHASDPACIVS